MLINLVLIIPIKSIQLVNTTIDFLSFASCHDSGNRSTGNKLCERHSYSVKPVMRNPSIGIRNIERDVHRRRAIFDQVLPLHMVQDGIKAAFQDCHTVRVNHANKIGNQNAAEMMKIASQKPTQSSPPYVDVIEPHHKAARRLTYGTGSPQDRRGAEASPLPQSWSV